MVKNSSISSSGDFKLVGNSTRSNKVLYTEANSSGLLVYPASSVKENEYEYYSGLKITHTTKPFLYKWIKKI